MSTAGKVAAGVGAVGAGLALRKPMATLKGLNALRLQLMLSGFALPKSILGNVGAVAAESMERGSTKPLREFFSRQTLRDAKDAWKATKAAGPMPGVDPGTTLSIAGRNLPSPGRAMGAMDVATRNSLERSGLSADDAARAVFQTPLEGQLASTLETEPAKYLIPFRRTPFNQFFEGFKAMGKENRAAHPRVLAGYGAAGAVHGATTADEQYPVTIPLAIAGAAKYGVPYALAALASRHYLGQAKTPGGVAGTILPLSEYGIESGITAPERAFEPAAVRAIRRMRGY